MKLKFYFGGIEVFGWCLNQDPNYFAQMISGVQNGEIIVQESIRLLHPQTEYVYIFFDSVNPVVIAKAFIGQVEYKGFYPDPIAPYGYLFSAKSEITISGIGTDPNMQVPDQVVLPKKKL